MATLGICILVTPLPGVLALEVIAIGLNIVLALQKRVLMILYLVAIPLKIKISAGGLPVFFGFQGTIMLWHHQCFQ